MWEFLKRTFFLRAPGVKQFGASFDSDLGPKRTSSSDFHINGVDFMEGSRVDDDVPDSPCSPGMLLTQLTANLFLSQLCNPVVELALRMKSIAVTFI